MNMKVAIPSEKDEYSMNDEKSGLINSLKIKYILVLVMIISMGFTFLYALFNCCFENIRLFNPFINDFNINSQLKPPQFNVSFKDINEEEYLKLGLTPNKPIIIDSIDDDISDGLKQKILHGRFLHITDIHPDEYYKEGSLIEEACHRGHGKKKSNQIASKYGDALLGCDSPMILMDKTLKWIEDNLKDKIDFVIWTGDNIRHDSDRRIPRTELQIFDMNEKVAHKFINIFSSKNSLDPRDFEVPVIPSLGNNDVYPHNLFSPGPTLQTRELWNIWQNFIPQEQLHVFERGAYFFNEVIPNKLAVLSINTLYLFKANPLVDNCDRRKEPGYKLFQWLGVVLQELRNRNMKVWLSGHVPPVPKNYDISCYRKYAVWLHEYRDIIIGGVYGHMNLDHFVPVDSQKAYDSIEQKLRFKKLEENDDEEEEEEEEEDFSLEEQYSMFGMDLLQPDLNAAMAASDAHLMGGAPSGKENYMESVRKSFYADVKKPSKQGQNSERYSIVNVAASVVPTFNPGLRVWEYNLTGIEESLNMQVKPWSEFFKELDSQMKINELKDAFSFDDDNNNDDDNDNDDENEVMIEKKKKKKGKKKKGKKKKDPSLPPKMPQDQPLGPAYVPQTFSPTKFVQFFVNLTAINQGDKKFEYELEFKSDDEPYYMKSLLVQDYLELARKFAKPLKDKSGKNEDKEEEQINGVSKLQQLWETYLKHVFVSSGYHDE